MKCVGRLLLVGLLGLGGCGQPQTDAGATLAALFSGAGAEWIDMSYSYDESTIFWPTAQPFELEVVAAAAHIWTLPSTSRRAATRWNRSRSSG